MRQWLMTEILSRRWTLIKFDVRWKLSDKEAAILCAEISLTFSAEFTYWYLKENVKKI